MLEFQRMTVGAFVFFLPWLAVDTFAETNQARWKKHVIHEGEHCNTAIAADFTGDGAIDVISSSNATTRLFVGPDWRVIVLNRNPENDFIHSEAFDVDGDGDQDYLAARYSPGRIVWLENPGDATHDAWTEHLVDDQVNGIHGLIRGDVDGDGILDLLATSAQPKPPFPNSLAWFKTVRSGRGAGFERHLFAVEDAPGLTHYLGFGDVNGDGRPDAATGAKGGPSAEPGTGDYFAWWEAAPDPRRPWRKHLIAGNQPGATNIHPADVNGDGQVDFIASRGHGRGVVWFEAPRWKEHAIHATLKEPHALVVGDLDGDGDADAASCAFGDQQALWFENQGDGSFVTHLVGEQQEAYDIRAIDLDNDQDLDLLIAGRGSKNVVWYERQ